MAPRKSRQPGPATVGEDVRRELQSHIDMRVDELVRAGMEPAAARAQSLREFGDPERIATSCVAAAAPPARASLREGLEALLQDVRYALRGLRKNPMFTATTCLTLALGIGANAAIFSVVNGVLLRPLPYPDADRLVAIWERNPDGRENSIAAANFLDWRERSTAFASMALMPTYSFFGRTPVIGGDQPARVLVAPVTIDFFETIGVQPALGRTFAADEATEGVAPVIVVSHALWQQLLGANPDLGSLSLSIDGYRAPVIGVMPPGFTFPGRTDIWFPRELYGFGASRTSHGEAAIARLRDGVTLEAAAAEIDAIGASLAQEYAGDINAAGVNLRPLRAELVGSRSTPLLLLLGASALLLLVACANIAGALLARGATRAREMAVRAALGAGRGRLVRQLFTESALLTAVGTLLGLALARAGRTALLELAPTTLPVGTSAPIDAGVLAFTALAAALTAVAFGLPPALRASRQQPADALRARTDGDDGGGRRLWSGLVVAEVAIALTLLVGTGVLVRNLWNVLATDAGFDADGLLTIDVSLPVETYPGFDDVRALHDRLQEALATLPGVTSVGVVSNLPLGGHSTNGAFDVEGREPRAGYSDYRVAGPDYFRTMGIPVLRGREFAHTDEDAAVVIVNQAVADATWPGEDPIGKRIGNFANDNWVYGDEWVTVIGVVANVRTRALDAPPRQAVYVNYRQRPRGVRDAAIVVRTDGDPDALTASVRDRVRAIDEELPAEYVAMRRIVASSVSDRTFLVVVLGAFAVAAALLSSLGIYAVAAHSVARRTREMGIRLALGAAPQRVRRMIVADTLRPVLLGLGLGTALSLALGQALGSLLQGFGASDPATLAVVVALLLVVAWVATALPARRVTRIDPLSAIRAE